jgi:hypothetical protein
MNTDRINTNTYLMVVESLKQINANRTFANIGTPERADLDTTASLLTDLSWRIVNKDIGQMSKEISDSVSELRQLSKKISESYESLKQLSADIDKAAVAVDTLVNITTMAIAAGIL